MQQPYFYEQSEQLINPDADHQLIQILGEHPEILADEKDDTWVLLCRFGTPHIEEPDGRTIVIWLPDDKSARDQIKAFKKVSIFPDRGHFYDCVYGSVAQLRNVVNEG